MSDTEPVASRLIPEGGLDSRNSLTNYQIEGSLGNPSMAIVLSGKNIKSGEKVAIKVQALSTLDGDESFLRAEADVLKQIDYPSVVRLVSYFEEALPHDLDVSNTAPLARRKIEALRGKQVGILVTGLIEGKSLSSMVLSGEIAGLPLAQRLEIIDNVGQTIDYLAAKGIFHRDISMNNIFVTKEGIKIIDFGVSNKVPKQTNEMLYESAGYAPPESSTPDELDQQSEVFNLAVLAYNLLTNGSNPYGKTEFPTKYGTTAVFPVPNLWVKVHGLDESPLDKITENEVAKSLIGDKQKLRLLDDIFRNALAIKKQDRYQAAGEFVEAVKISLS